MVNKTLTVILRKMHPTVRVLSERAHRPLIKFLGKRTWPSTPIPRHPHPAAPAELRNSFADFVKKSEAQPSSQPSTSTDRVYPDFWQAPERLWNPRVHEIDEREIDAILSGGASLY